MMCKIGCVLWRDKIYSFLRFYTKNVVNQKQNVKKWEHFEINKIIYKLILKFQNMNFPSLHVKNEVQRKQDFKNDKFLTLVKSENA